MTRVRASLTVQVDGRTLTPKQAEAVLTLFMNGTQRAAARALGVSAPVLNRHLRQVEAKIGSPIMECTPRGSVLNDLGESIAREQLALKGKLREREHLTVGCTPLSQELMLNALNMVDTRGEAEVVISEDRHNVVEFQAGMMDLVVLDDPLFAYEAEGGSWEEIGSDRLVHIRRGEDYALYRFGPQRLGFRHLDSTGERYRVVRTYSSLDSLLRSRYSMFVSEGLLARREQRFESATDPALLSFSIICLYRPGDSRVEALAKALMPGRG